MPGEAVSPDVEFRAVSKRFGVLAVSLALMIAAQLLLRRRESAAG